MHLSDSKCIASALLINVCIVASPSPLLLAFAFLLYLQHRFAARYQQL
jgi:hypothetical protein